MLKLRMQRNGLCPFSALVSNDPRILILVWRLSSVPIYFSLLEINIMCFCVLFFDSFDGFIPKYFSFLSHQKLTLIIHSVLENFQIIMSYYWSNFVSVNVN